MDILHTVLYAFPMLLAGRTGLTTKSFLKGRLFLKYILISLMFDSPPREKKAPLRIGKVGKEAPFDMQIRTSQGTQGQSL